MVITAAGIGLWWPAAFSMPLNTKTPYYSYAHPVDTLGKDTLPVNSFVKLFYNRLRTVPKISTSVPVTTVNAGLQIRIVLAK